VKYYSNMKQRTQHRVPFKQRVREDSTAHPAILAV
jgi:hypothetical protein